MSRPHIGITTSYEKGSQHLTHYYVLAIEAAGGLPLPVPMVQDNETMTDFAALLDGLLITGGPAIMDGLIGELPADLDAPDPIRDTADRLIYAAMQEQPIMGICYGMQFINARHGGTIYADVMAQQPGTAAHSSGRGGTTHPIEIAAESRLREILNRPTLNVNTYHVQAVAEVGTGLRAVARSDDGVIEAVESTDGREIGVQFHPERMLDQTLAFFQDFVDRCRG